MAFRAALPTALSQALIAFTIEFDNELSRSGEPCVVQINGVGLPAAVG
jgi:hypothetical protein